jgi:hypothetical protein
VKTSFRQVVLRVAAATGLLVGSSLVGCSSSNETPAPGPSTAGTPANMAGTPATAGTGTGGTSATGGTGGAGAGGGSACPGNQIMLMGACACPPYAPKFCTAAMKCVSDMKDPDNCGECAKACGATQACSMGACTPDLAPFAEVAGCGTLLLVSVAGKAIYALSTATGDLNSIALPAGGAPVKLATVAGGTAFAVDATNAYVAAGMTVVRVPLAGGAPVPVVTAETGKIMDVAISGTKLYYAVGKDVKELEAATPAAMGTSVAKSADEGVAEGLAVIGGYALYASNQAFNLESQPIGMPATAHVKIGASQSNLIFGHRSVQADPTYVYWVNGSLQKAKYAGDDHAGTVAAQPIDGSGIIAYAVDGAGMSAYIATKDGSFEKQTFAAAAAGDEAAWVARKLPAVSSVVLDETSVYLASECKILKSAR